MMTWLDIWKQMAARDRLDAAHAFWDGAEPGGACERSAIEALASEHRFRLKSVERLPDETRAKWLAASVRPPQSVVQAALQRFHLGPRKQMLIRFLDELGIPHTEGVVERDQNAGYAIPEAQLRKASLAIAVEFTTAWRVLYYRVLLASGAPMWFALDGVIHESLQPFGTRADDNDAADEAAESEPDLTFPRGGSFDLLDDLLISAIIGSVGEQLSALDADGVRELVDQVRRLNLERCRTYFHVGFLDALQGSALSINEPEANDEHRGWYLTGALNGLIRQNQYEPARKLIVEHKRIFALIGAGDLESTPVAIPLVFDVLLHERSLGSFLELARPKAIAATRRLSSEDGMTFMRKLLDAAADHLRAREAAEAKPILDLLSDVEKHQSEEGDPPDARFCLDLRRRQAHARRLTGDFEGAEKLLREILAESGGKYEAMILADLGMIACGILTLGDVCFPRDAAEKAATALDLERGRDLFEVSAAASGRGGHGEYCLAVYHLCGDRPKDALPLLESAVVKMERRSSIYYGKVLRVLPRARLYLAYCLANDANPVNAQRVADLATGTALEFWKEAHDFIEIVLLFLETHRPEAAMTLASRILPEHPEFLDPIIGAGLLPRSAAVRAALRQRAESRAGSRKQQFDDWERLLRPCADAADRDGAETALDALEGLTESTPECDRFIELLRNPDRRHLLVWDRDDIDLSLVRLHQARGERLEAAALLTALGHRLASAVGDETGNRNRNPIGEIEDNIDQIRKLGVEPDSGLCARFGALRAGAEVSITAPAPQTEGQIVFFGGNETQARYQQNVSTWVASQWPHIEVVFKPVGWSSNWGREKEQFAKEIAGADAVVLMRFVRTQLGRFVRAACGEHDVPWVACTGHGKQSLKRSIEAAVRVLGQEAI